MAHRVLCTLAWALWGFALLALSQTMATQGTVDRWGQPELPAKPGHQGWCWALALSWLVAVPLSAWCML